MSIEELKIDVPTRVPHIRCDQCSRLLKLTDGLRHPPDSKGWVCCHLFQPEAEVADQHLCPDCRKLFEEFLRSKRLLTVVPGGAA